MSTEQSSSGAVCAPAAAGLSLWSHTALIKLASQAAQGTPAAFLLDARPVHPSLTIEIFLFLFFSK